MRITKSRVKAHLYKPQGDWYMERQQNAIVLTLYSARDCHRCGIYDNHFQSRFNVESLTPSIAQWPQRYRITTKEVK